MRVSHTLPRLILSLLIASALLLSTASLWKATAAPRPETNINRIANRATSAAPIARTLTDNHTDGDFINPMQSQNGTWGPGTITATANVTILPTVTIAINPGTTILVEDGVRFTVEGNLHSSGPLTFTPANSSPNPGDWKGVLYAPGSSGYLTYATVQYAEHAVTLNTTHPVTIANSELRYNRYISDTLAAGAGLYIVQGNPLITGTQIHNNTIEATGEGEVRGAGIYIQDGSPHIINTWIYENTATGERAGAGGGIGILAGGALIENCYVLTNTLQGYTNGNDPYPYYDRTKAGGGIGFAGFSEEDAAKSTTVEIRNNWIANNMNIPTYRGLAAGGGIGLGAYARANLVDANVIINNRAGKEEWRYGEGGGIDTWYYNDLIASNNLIYNNKATDSGGGIFLNGTAKAFNNTIVDNTADLGGGIYRQANQQQIFNNIIVDNRATESSGGVFLQQDSGSAGYNNVWRNEPNNYDDPRAIPVTDYQVDPWFAGEGNIVERYHLLPYSPLTGVATDTLPGLPTTDYDGDERPKYIARDIGFDEVVLNPDLPTVSIQKSSPFLGSGEVLEYTILIINNTTATYTTHITDVLPANITYNSGPRANCDGSGSYEEAHNRIIWKGTIPPNLFLNLRYSVLVDINLPDGTPITNTAMLSITNIVTPETLITTTNVVTTFVHNPDFELSQSPLDSETKIAGSPFTYQIEAQNTTQSGRATDVILTNTLPTYVYFVEASGAGVYQGQTISWTIPFIAAGGVVWRTVEVSTCQNFTNTLYRIITSTQLVSSTLGPQVTYSVTPPTLNASFEQSSADAKVSVPVHFTSTSTTNGSSLTALWDFGDGVTATGKTVSHAYVTSDTYTVRLTVADRCGFTSSQAVSISAYAPPLRISKNALTDIKPGETLTYTITVLSEKNNTNVLISDTLPANTEFLTGSITLDPETVGDKGNAPPILAQAITLTPGQRITLTYAAVVTSPLSAGTRIVNAVTVTSTAAPTPTRAIFTSTVVNVPPEISDTTRVITENVEMGTYIDVPVTGSDANKDILTYTIIAGNLDQAFTINPDTGQITVNGALDHETKPAYVLTLQASDSTLTDTASVTITVLDINEAPVITDTTRTITENVSLGTLVGRPITGTDVDGDDILTYTIVGNSIFAIHPSTGQITVSGALDHEAQAQYTLTVQVIDTGSLTETASVTITVLDVNEAPVINDATRTITENVSLGTPVGNPVIGTDVDADDILTYTIAGSGMFAIHPSTGQITVSGALDYEAQAQYELTVQVTDGALTDTARVSITVLDINEAPVINDATRTITENTSVGTPVGAPLTGTDEDIGDDVLTYTITAGNQAHIFTISPNVGQIIVSDTLNYEAQPQYGLTIQVTDGALTDTARVSIIVLDINEAPVITDTSRTIMENALPGTPVGHPITGTDVDTDDTLTYTITANNAFTIQPHTGQITVSKRLDHEIQKQYTLTVSISDGMLTDTAHITITVLDVNEPPVIPNAIRTITENVSVGTYVGAPVTGTDEDVDDDVLTYTINASDQDKPFVIASNTGQISVSRVLDYETRSQYTLTVQASDGALTDTASVTITVLDINERPQFISTAITTATEDVAYTYIITATDPDKGDTMTLTAHTLPPWLTLTRTGNGTAKLSGTPNDAAIGDHPINLQVRDTSGLTATQRFALHVRGISNILADIILYPIEAIIQAGESQTYTVEALDESGGRIGDISEAATYTISPKAQGSWEENIYTSEIAGNWTVTATYRTTTVATATLTITPGQSRDLNLDFAETTIAAGEKQTYTTEAQDAFGNRWDVTANTIYTITPGAGGYWTDNVYTSEVAGTWTVTATYNSTVTTMTLTVIPGPIAQLTLSPTQATITAGQSQTYTLEAADAYQNTWDATASASYAISPQADGTCSDNVCTSQVADTWTITATYYTMTATATLSVTPDTPASIALTPSQATLTVGKVQAYHVNASDAFGNAWDATASATYAISPQAGGTWSANVYTSEIVGTWTITATVATGTNPVSDTATLNVRPLADLTLIKYTPNSTVRPGDIILYTLIYTNTGESETGVSAILTETVPAYTTFDAVMSTDGWICQPDIKAGSTCVHPLDDLTGGASSHKLFAVTVDPSLTPTVKQISNTATVGYAAGYDPDPTPNNNTSTVTVSVQHDGIDLAIHKTNQRDIVHPNDTLVYTLTIMNNGTLDTTGVQVTDTLPTQVTFVQASHGGTVTDGNVRWPTFDLPSGEYRSGSSPNTRSSVSTSRLVTVTVNNDAIVGITATLTNTAYVSDDGRHGADTNPRNNRAEDIDTVQQREQPDLMLTKQVTNTSAVTRQHPVEKQCYPGDKLHYTVTVQNTGNRVASQVIITDTLPPYVMLLSATPGGLRSETSSNRKPEAPADRDIIIWTSSDLNIGERRTYTITALVSEQIPTDNLSLINTAEASMSISDPTPDNNIAVAEIWLAQRPISPSILYLPLVTRNYTQAPDLIITSVIVTRDNVEITLKNVGERAVVNPFWVDLYVNPDPIPTGVNELWDELGEQGALWGFSNIPVDPEETIILMLNDDAYWGHKSNLPLPLPSDAVIYVQVDSAHAGTDYGAVREVHEICDLPYNNIYGPISPTSQVNLTQIDPLRTSKPQSTEDLPPRD